LNILFLFYQYDASKDLRLVMEQLGHTTLAAAQIYIHQPPEQDKRDAVNRIF
jgi:site-specific recombinase XerC